MSKSTDFLAQKELLNQMQLSTQKEVVTYRKLLRRLARDKANVKFLLKRIKLSNKVLEASGQEPISLDYASVGDDELDSGEDEEAITDGGGFVRRTWNKIPNLKE